MTLNINWLTQQGLIGVYPANISMSFKIEAVAIGGSITKYKIISGSLPIGMSFREDGRISGTPDIVKEYTTSTFVVRAFASNSSQTTIKDRTFILGVSGESIPTITTPSGPLGTSPIPDSTWVEIPILYNNPNINNKVNFKILQGSLPPGLEINEFGLIRGYPSPPIVKINLPLINGIIVATNSSNNRLTAISTEGFIKDRPIIFSGNSLGNIVLGQLYYIKNIINATEFTITSIPNGPETIINSTSTGFMDFSLPELGVGQPTKIQYSFTVELFSLDGSDNATYTMTIVNQNLLPSEGGIIPPTLPFSRVPTIYNTRPPNFNIKENFKDYGYFVLPSIQEGVIPGTTYLPNQEAYIGEFQSNTFFSFNILGHDFDNVDLQYEFSALPSWLSADTTTGWIYGIPLVAENNIEEFLFDVKTKKIIGNVEIFSDTFNFKFQIANNISSNIIWETETNLGTFFNSSPFYKNVKANADVTLEYSLLSGNLPSNLTLLSNGDIIGNISYQPDNNFTEILGENVFNFTVKCQATDSNLSNIITSTKSFEMTIKNILSTADILYIKCTPEVDDRIILESLLNNNYIIPQSYIYREDDNNFGKAKDVTYVHAYGIESTDLETYIEKITKNHYWKNVTLGELGTAKAKDDNGKILYEVVYSNIIDNLMKYDKTKGVDYRYATSIDEEIYWPRFIDLQLGSWYTSSKEFFTSYIFAKDAYISTSLRNFNIITQDSSPLIINQGLPSFYTSLTPGYARILYPNSLENMRLRVEQEIGYNYDFRRLPLWMTSQQPDGNTLGFTPCWVICYTKPIEIIKTIATQTISEINAILIESVDDIIPGSKIVFTGNTFGNILNNKTYFVKEVGLVGYPKGITISSTKNGEVYKVYNESGIMTATFDPGSYAEIIKERIEKDWPHKLNKIDFKIDRFSVDKTMTYDYENKLDPKTWADYPGANPVPDPIDSENFYVIFQQKTVLPEKTQYNL